MGILLPLAIKDLLKQFGRLFQLQIIMAGSITSESSLNYLVEVF